MSFESPFGQVPAALWPQLRVVREQSSRIRDIQGFRKGHHVPSEVNAYAAEFVGRIAAPEIDLEVEARFSEFRTRYGLKRSQISFSDAERGCGQIHTPWFSYQLAVTQSNEDPAMAIWRRSVCDIKSPDVMLSETTSGLFAASFDRVEFRPDEPVCVPVLIDQLEERELPGLSLDYDRHATRCSIGLKGSSDVLQVTSEELAFIVAQPSAPGRLLQGFIQLYSQVADSGSGNGLRLA